MMLAILKALTLLLLEILLFLLSCVKFSLKVLLFPLCLILFAWIERPVWKEYRNLSNYKANLGYKDDSHSDIEVLKDPKGKFLVQTQDHPGNFFVWFWNRMYATVNND